MKMLTKFESRSSRAKVVAFHPTRPWVLVGLYTSTIQLWDYRMGTVLDRFEGHEGPVRGIDVHPTQQMFVSCGDDATVRVWSLQDRRLLFTLTGHFDYVRTAFFHPELPWIISASDDQTIRIWNWQSRQEIACLTGHNHWVSCAKFHPTEDIVVSGSMDTMVRVWDISGLRKRHAPGVGPGISGLAGGLPGLAGGLPPGLPGGIPGAPPSGFPGSMGTGFPGGPGGPGDDDLFATDAVVKYVLQGHDRSVTWVDIHPTLPLIISASDDRTIKVWRMSESRAWEVDTCRGHSDDVTGCAFDPYQDLILSCGADKTIRLWDLHKRTPVHTFKRDGDKFWGTWFHPHQNLVGAAHDSGVIVFKLERERPASTHTPEGGLLYLGRDKFLRDQSGRQLLTLKRFGSPYEPLRELSYNAAERSVIATTGDGYVLAKIPSSGIEPQRVAEQAQNGFQALFVSRNRFCVLPRRGADSLEIRDMENALTKTVPLPIETLRLAPAADAGHLLLLGAKSVVLFDVQQGRVVAKLAAAGIKYVAWNAPHNTHVALQAKHQVVLATSRLVEVAQLRETIRIKSVAWDRDVPVLVYTTFNHLKYALLNGDTGVLRTTARTLYVATARGADILALDREGNAQTLVIDPTEYRFKRALTTGQYGEVARLIRTSQLVGQAIVAYLQKRGHPEIALEFVQDPRTRLDLAVECGNLQVAANEARQLGSADADAQLARAALEQGNHDLLEDVYQRQHELDRLALLYLVTGHRGRLQRVEAVAEHRGDPSAQFQTSLFLGSVQTRVELLANAGLTPLAWALAKSHGLHERAAELGAGHDTSKIAWHDVSQDPVVGVSHETYKENWPVHSVQHVSILDAVDNLTLDGEGETNVPVGPVNGEANETEPLEEDLGDDWDLDVDIGEVPEVDDAAVVASETSVPESWLRGSHLVADHVAAGSFETAAQLLNRQAGVVNFGPLKKRFLAVYAASKLALAGHEGLSPLPFYVLRVNSRLPFVPGLDHLPKLLNEAYAQVKAAQLEAAVDTFRQALYTVVVLAVNSEAEADECWRVVETCRNYILAFSIELKRRALPADDIKRNLELAAYFTRPKLRAAHATLPLRVALMQAFNAKNFVLAGHFAAEYLKLEPTGPGAEKVRRIKARCDANPLDAVDIDFDMFAEFDICPGTLTPIYAGQPTEIDPLTKARYHASQKGRLCSITGITQVGAAASGLRLF